MKYFKLKHKILSGYLVLTAVIVSMVAVLFFERNRVQEIESELDAISEIQSSINSAHRYITILATFGESCVVWSDEDYQNYHERRLKTDSLLQEMKEPCAQFVSTEQIDTLRSLLADKEEHLFGIMQAVRSQDTANDILLSRLSAGKPSMRTIVKKKKGIAGWFGKKDTIRVSQSPEALYSLNKELTAMQEKREKELETCTDSLRSRNRELNRKLHMLIMDLDEQAAVTFRNKKQYLEKAYRHSTRIVTVSLVFSLVLLCLLYYKIHKELKRDAQQKEKLQRINEENKDLLDMRKRIILAITHDIRGPLNIINGSADLAKIARNKKLRDKYLTNIGYICRHVTHLLNNLLDVYRLKESKETCNNIPFCLDEFLERVVIGFSHVANDKGILFVPNFENVDVILCGDIDRLSQITDNLLSNALKFTNAGSINFDAVYKDGNLTLEVKDTGIGMSKETLDRIYCPFEKLAIAANTNGYGLGLPITKGLVKLLGGTIEVESEENKGTTFTVSIPMQVSNTELKNEMPQAERTGKLPNSVLVIDDDTLQLNIIRDMLERNGVMCTVCSDIKDMVLAMRNKDYDLILTDIQMTTISGFDLLELLRRSNIGNSKVIPVIAMTAQGDTDKSDFIKAGFSDCIYKPFAMEELLGLLSMFTIKEDGMMTHDFSALIEDVVDKPGILRAFIEQTGLDIKELMAVQKPYDSAKLREILHRMSPAWTLLGSERILSDLRTHLKKEKPDTNTIKSDIRRITEYAAILMNEAENELNRYSHETQDIDS